MGDGVRLSRPSLRGFFFVAVPTVTLGPARFMLTTGASASKYMSVAPESTIPVDFVGSARCWCVWAQLDLTLFMFGKVEGVVSRVGIKFSV